MNEKEFSAPGNEVAAPCEEFAQPGNEFFAPGAEQYALGSEWNQKASPAPPRKRKHRVPPVFAAAAAIAVVSIATMTQYTGRVEPTYQGIGYYEDWSGFSANVYGNICLYDPTSPYGYSAFQDPDTQEGLSFRLLDSSPGVEFCDLTKGNIPSWVPQDYRDEKVWLAYLLPELDDTSEQDAFFRVELNTKDVSRTAEYHMVPHNQLPGVRYEPCTIQQGEPFLLTDYLHLPDKPGFEQYSYASYLLDWNLPVDQCWEQRIELAHDATNPNCYILNQPLREDGDYYLYWSSVWENGNPDENLHYSGYLPVTMAKSASSAPTPAPSSKS